MLGLNSTVAVVEEEFSVAVISCVAKEYYSTVANYSEMSSFNYYHHHLPCCNAFLIPSIKIADASKQALFFLPSHSFHSISRYKYCKGFRKGSKIHNSICNYTLCPGEILNLKRRRRKSKRKDCATGISWQDWALAKGNRYRCVSSIKIIKLFSFPGSSYNFLPAKENTNIITRTREEEPIPQINRWLCVQLITIVCARMLSITQIQRPSNTNTGWAQLAPQNISNEISNNHSFWWPLPAMNDFLFQAYTATHWNVQSSRSRTFWILQSASS